MAAEGWKHLFNIKLEKFNGDHWCAGAVVFPQSHVPAPNPWK